MAVYTHGKKLCVRITLITQTQLINIKFETYMYIAFPIHTFYHQNCTRYHERHVRHLHFLSKQFLAPLLLYHSMQHIELLQDISFGRVRYEKHFILVNYFSKNRKKQHASK